MLPWEDKSQTKWNEDTLTDKEWRECLDQYLWQGTICEENFLKLNKSQKWLIDEVRKSRARKGQRLKPIAK